MELKNVDKRVVIKVDLESKNSHKFANGTTIRLEREYGNLNQREVKPVNAIVVSGDGVPVGAQILVHHNATHESNKIYDYCALSGDSEIDNVKYFSIPEENCYAWIGEDGEPQPLSGFALALRVFEPYKGVVQGIEPKILQDYLYLTTSLLKGLVVGTLKSCDYEIVYQGSDGREKRVIRLRHSDDEDLEKEEVIFIHHELTERVNNGDLWVGLSPQTAKPINTTNNEIESQSIQRNVAT
jgi:hypothetical protein